MPSSNSGNTNSNSNTIGTSRIQISLSKEQRMSRTAASVTLAKATGKTNTNINSDGSNSDTNARKTIRSTITDNPMLYKSVRKALKNQTLNFKINVECTSLKVSPSGNLLWGGFSDGTLRVWDLSGTFGVEDDDVIASRQKTDVLVNSKLTQGYGAVACQIHARGVHTDLITTVDISDDTQYVFVGVARGATELYAVFVGDLERAVHTHMQREQDVHNENKRNILDYLKVYCHSDAKLKGFGACATTRVVRATEQANPSPSYLLLTGKGIKNIHIWKFTPPEHSNSEESDNHDDGFGRNRKQSICDEPDDDEDNGLWDQLYDTSTNGNTILLLSFYRNPQNKLLAVSKSGAQKLRLWDLSFEEDPRNWKNPSLERPKRPPYQDVVNSQSALDIAGGIGVCGGGILYNVMSIVSLDKPDDPFNHTELALPSAVASDANGMAQQSYSSRRQRRGEMKAVVKVATSPRDSSHALLELDDGSLVGYSTVSSGSSSKDTSVSIPRLAIATPESTGIPALPADFWRRCICLANIAGVVIAASSLYNPNTNKGQLVIRALGGLKKPRGSVVMEKKKLKLLKQRKQRERLERERLEQEQLEREELKRERERLLLKQQQLESERSERERFERERERLLLKQQQLERERFERERERLLLKQQQLEQRKQDQQQQAVAPPKTPSPIHTSSQLSPVAADTKALRDTVSAPRAVPVSVLRTNKNPSDTKGELIDASNTTDMQFSSSVSLTRVSPNGSMETPRHQKNMTKDQDDSPDSTQGLPKISKFLLPKRIHVQALQEKSKKRKIQQPQKTEIAKSASAVTILKKELKAIKKALKASIVAESTAIETPQTTKKTAEKVVAAAANTSDSPVAMFQLNSIGNVQLKSPKPPPKKLKKLGAPSKATTLSIPTSVPSISFSTPKSSRNVPGKDSKLKAESCVVASIKPSEKRIAKVSSAVGERKRDRPAVENGVAAVVSKKIARTSDELSTALLLTALASPKPAEKAKSKQLADANVGVTPKTPATTGKSKAVTTVTPKAAAVASQFKATIKNTPSPKLPRDFSRSKIVSPPAAMKNISNSVSKSNGKSATLQNASTSPQQSSKEEILYEKISEQYQQLRTFLNGVTDSSMALIHSRNLRGPVPSALASRAAKSERAHLSAYSKLLTEHRAAHDYLQRRLLRSAETTLRLLLESRITAEEARIEFKQSIKKFEEILYDTLHRQEVERLAVVAKHYGTPANFARSRKLPYSASNRPLESIKEHSKYPCKEAFDKVEDICNALTRPVGRPRSAVAALR